MSHSTEVSIHIGMIGLSFTYGTGSVASELGVFEVRKPLEIRGAEVRGYLSILLPKMEDFHADLVQRVLDNHDAEFTALDRLEFESAFQALSVRVVRHD